MIVLAISVALSLTILGAIISVTVLVVKNLEL